MTEFYRPPAPVPMTSTAQVVMNGLFSRDNDLIKLVSEDTYGRYMIRVPFSRTPTYVVNCPKTISRVMKAEVDNYPKCDVTTAALDGLVGQSIFTVSGAVWKRQHRMISQVFAKLKLSDVFLEMQKAIVESLDRIEAKVGGTLNIDTEMSYVTADVIFRTMFSRPIDDSEARLIFDEFANYQNALPHTTVWSLLTSTSHNRKALPRRAQQAADRIRGVILQLLVERRTGKVRHDDICQIIADCRDPEDGKPFTDQEAIDQIAFFFLAGHETSASALAWAFICLSGDKAVADRVAAEAQAITSGDFVAFADRGRLTTTRAVFREALRLYPPVAFFGRRAIDAGKLRSFEIAPDSLIVVSPWIVQRHRKFWTYPEQFVPDRFLSDDYGQQIAGTWIPFGFGPRVCTGAAFATMEAELILSEICRRYHLKVCNPEKIRAASRLTVKPLENVPVFVERR